MHQQIDRVHLLVIMNIDHRLRPLTRWHLTLEQNVDLTVRAALHLREEEVSCNQAEEASCAPDVSALATEVAALLRC